MERDEAGLLELIENIVFPWGYQWINPDPHELPDEGLPVFPCVHALFDRNLD
jgi:hypothetical protein